MHVLQRLCASNSSDLSIALSFSHAFSSVVTRWQLQSVVDISVVDGAGSSHLLHRWTLGISPSLLLIDAGLLMLSIRQPNLFPIEATRVHQQLYSVAYVHEQ